MKKKCFLEILVIFPLLEIIGKKKKFGIEPGWATAQLSLRMGAGLGTGLGVLGAGLGVQARRQQAWQQALGRSRTARACADGRGARGRARGARTGAQGAAGEARGRQGTDARGRTAGAGARGRRAGGRARRGARQAQAGARGAAGWAACARLVCAAGPGWVFCYT